MIRIQKAAVWACAIFLALVFTYAGILKLEGISAVRWAERFAHWGYPAHTYYVIGVLEILGGIGVLIPRLRRAAALLLVIVMAGALCTHAIHGEFGRFIPPLLLGGLALLLLRASGSTVSLKAGHSGQRPPSQAL